jgi:hypothetical protein
LQAFSQSQEKVMIEILPQSTGNVVAIRVNGKLVHQDYQQFLPRLESVLEQYGSVRCYCEMVNFEGFTWRAMLDEMKFDVTHWNKIERCALVGHASWNPWMTRFAQMLFGSARVKSFTPDQAGQAWSWVTENAQYAGASCGADTTSRKSASYTSDDTWGNATGTTDPTCGRTL